MYCIMQHTANSNNEIFGSIRLAVVPNNIIFSTIHVVAYASLLEGFHDYFIFFHTVPRLLQVPSTSLVDCGLL